ncbi:hypothetical protein MNB_SV-12-784 [hydrothermal vent metagenome]|uniref:Lipoprotein n=1 Tax=hydrothermal vent metagenome TaxID=652676 RepID=A0A1W1BDI2_9ZZZZ
MYRAIIILFLIILVGCGSGGSKTKIDISEYLPKILTKKYTEVSKLIDSKMQNSEFTENITLESNKITVKVNGAVTTVSTILEDKINIQTAGDNNRTKTMKRRVSNGDKVIEDIQENKTETLKVGSQIVGDRSIKIEESCKLEGSVKEFSKYFYLYENYDDEHDIIKLKCTTVKTEITSVKPEFADDVIYENGTVEFKPNTSYIYMQRGIGTIATIDDDCITEKSPKVIIDDTARPSECIGEQYNYILYDNS